MKLKNFFQIFNLINLFEKFTTSLYVIQPLLDFNSRQEKQWFFTDNIYIPIVFANVFVYYSSYE